MVKRWGMAKHLARPTAKRSETETHSATRSEMETHSGKRLETRKEKSWVMVKRSVKPMERNSEMEKRSVMETHSVKLTAKRWVMATRSGTPTVRNSVMEKRSVKLTAMRSAMARRWENCSGYSKATNSVPDPGPYVDFLHKRKVLIFVNLLVKQSGSASFL